MSLTLILTHANDSSADMVINHLNKKGADHIRFNTEEFPQKVGLELNIDSDGASAGTINFPNRKVTLEEISSVWNRRPHRPQIDERVKNAAMRSWAQDEAEQVLQSLWLILEDCFWVNNLINHERVKFNKWIQMKEASNIGFVIPPSLITNIPGRAEKFWLKHNRSMAFKPVRSGMLEYSDGRRTIIHTKRISLENLNTKSLELISISPVFLQKYIEKFFEYRVTVVGEKIFSCEIHSQENRLTKEDWRGRLFSKEAIIHKACTLPPKIEEKCFNIIKRLGLVFGAIDLILTPDREYVFLEINPGGQWAWIEKLTGLPIAEAIASLLITHC